MTSCAPETNLSRSVVRYLHRPSPEVFDSVFWQVIRDSEECCYDYSASNQRLGNNLIMRKYGRFKKEKYFRVLVIVSELISNL